MKRSSQPCDPWQIHRFAEPAPHEAAHLPAGGTWTGGEECGGYGYPVSDDGFMLVMLKGAPWD